MSRSPHECPSCGGRLIVLRLECESCGLGVDGAFERCPMCALPPELQWLLEVYLASKGNVRAVQRALGVSYPTARSRMEELFEGLDLDTEKLAPRRPMEVLDMLAEGRITVEQAEKLLRGRTVPRDAE